VRTSESEQVFLVSGHFSSTLVPDPQKLERSDEEMRSLQRVAKRPPEPRASGEDADPGHRSSEHNHEAEMPKQVPGQMLQSLRTIAESQRAASATTDSKATVD
jgi:hypothetical protein